MTAAAETARLAAHAFLHGDDVRHDDHVRADGSGALGPGDEGIAASARVSGHVALNVGFGQKDVTMKIGMEPFAEQRVKFVQRLCGNSFLVFGNEAGKKLGGLRGLREGRNGHHKIGHDEALLFVCLLAAGQQAEAEQSEKKMAEMHQSRLPLVLGMRSSLRRTACASASPSPLAADSSR